MYYEYPGKEIIRREFNLGEDFEFPKKKMEAHAMGYYVSFQMFARWLARDDNYKSNIHWNTVQVQFCKTENFRFYQIDNFNVNV